MACRSTSYCTLDLTRTMGASHAAQVRSVDELSHLLLNRLSLFAENGFRAYNVDPFREFFRNVFKEGGIGIVEMLYR